MLKKIGHILIISLLLVSTSGISVTRHYCGSSLKSFSIFSTPSKCCEGRCDKCHNKHSFTKVTDEFINTSIDIPDLKADSQILHAIIIYTISDQLSSGNLPIDIDLRKFLYTKAGDSPALICNFRC